VLVLSRDDVRSVIRLEAVVAAVENAHAALAAGDATQAIDRTTPLPSGTA